MKTQLKRIEGFTLIEIMIVVGLIGVLAAIAVPNAIQARDRSQKHACINNLRQIDSAKQQWGLETGSAPNRVPLVSQLQPYLGRGAMSTPPLCPADSRQTFESSYVINNLQKPPQCRIDPTNHLVQ